MLFPGLKGALLEMEDYWMLVSEQKELQFESRGILLPTTSEYTTVKVVRSLRSSHHKNHMTRFLVLRGLAGVLS